MNVASARLTSSGISNMTVFCSNSFHTQLNDGGTGMGTPYSSLNLRVRSTSEPRFEVLTRLVPISKYFDIENFDKSF